MKYTVACKKCGELQERDKNSLNVVCFQCKTYGGVLDLNSPFFTDPTTRFCEKYGIEDKVFHKLWYKYKWLHWTQHDIIDWVEIKFGKVIDRQRLSDVFLMMEVFLMSDRFKRDGHKSIRLSAFKPYDKFVEYKFSKKMDKIMDKSDTEKETVLS